MPPRVSSQASSRRSPKSQEPRQNSDHSSRLSSQPQARVKAPTGAVESIVVLAYGANNNFVLFRDQLTNYAGREFGDLARMLKLMQYWVPPDVIVDMDQLDPQNDPLGIKKDLYVKLLKDRVDRISRMERDKSRLYATIFGNLSPESRQRVEEAVDWVNIETSRDPLELWLRVCTVHMGGELRNPVLSRQNARAKYHSLRQGATETIVAFRRRFENSLELLDFAGADMPSNEDQAADFIAGLDSSRYAQFRVDLENGLENETRQFPDSFAAAFELASNYRVVSNSGSIVRAAAFVTESAPPREAPKSNSNPKRPTQASKRPESRPNGSSNLSRPLQRLVNQSGSSNRTQSSSQSNRSNRRPMSHGNSGPRNTNNRPCVICQAAPPTHWPRDCPHLETAHAAVSQQRSNIAVSASRSDSVYNIIAEDGEPPEFRAFTFVTRNTHAIENREVTFPVLFDNQASLSIFKDVSLLTDVRDAVSVRSFHGINTESGGLHVNKVGDFGPFGTVYCHPSAQANVLSMSQLRSIGTVTHYDGDSDTFRVNPPGCSTTFSFVPEDGLYVAKFTPSHFAEVSYTTTVNDNLQLYTARQRDDAEKVKHIARYLGYPSQANFIRMITTGAILNCPVTVHDVNRAYEIFGPDLAALRGKTHTRKPIAAKPELVPRLIGSKLVLFVDIMFVDKFPFLISVSQNLGLTMVSELGRMSGARAIASVREALSTQFSCYKSYGFTIQTLISDGEGAILALTAELQASGVEVNPAGPGQHVPVVERKIQEVKEHARGIFNTLPYSLPGNLITWLIQFVVNRINLFPHKGGYENVSPREAFCGRKVNFNIDARCGFGEYAECTDPSTADNTPASRTHACISLCPTGNLTGSVKFLSLQSNRIVTRDQFRIMPMPNIVISHMNRMAAQFRAQPHVELNFAMGEQQLAILDQFHEGVVPEVDINQNLHPNLIDINQQQNIMVADEVIANDEDVLFEHRADIGVPDGNLRVEEGDRGADPPNERAPVIINRFFQLPNPAPHHEEPAPEEPQPNQGVDNYPEVDDDDDEVVEIPAPADGVNPPIIIIEDPPPPDPTRRSVRLANHTPVRYDSRSGAPIRERVLNVSVSTALRTMRHRALEAMCAEILQMRDMKVFTPVHYHMLSEDERRKVIMSFMFLKEKYDASGNFEKLKARLVAGGHMQERDLTSNAETTSPTVSLMSVFMVTAIAAAENRKVVTIDITGAYLNGDISQKSIYMHLDPKMAAIICHSDPSYIKYLKSNGTITVRLLKALYGCIESAKIWFDTLSTFLIGIGFRPNPCDKCVLNMMQNRHQITVMIYVDDLYISSVSGVLIRHVIDRIKAKFLTITVKDGPRQSYLGMNFDFSMKGEVSVTMEGYTDDVLEYAKTSGVALTPAGNSLFDIESSTIPLGRAESEQFHSIVAKLLYLAKRTRPDILLPIAFLATRVQASTMTDWNKLQRVLKYLNGTKSLGIRFKPGPSLAITISVDASFGVHKDGKSHGCSVIAVGGPVQVCSYKETIVTKSSSEAEHVAASDKTGTALGLRQFAEHQGLKMPPVTLLQDNTSTIAMLHKDSPSSDRTRHIHIRRYWIKDRIDSGELRIMHQSTDDMIADIGTKPLQGERFLKLRSRLLNLNESSSPAPDPRAQPRAPRLREVPSTSVSGLIRARR